MQRDPMKEDPKSSQDLYEFRQLIQDQIELIDTHTSHAQYGVVSTKLRNMLKKNNDAVIKPLLKELQDITRRYEYFKKEKPELYYGLTPAQQKNLDDVSAQAQRKYGGEDPDPTATRIAKLEAELSGPSFKGAVKPLIESYRTMTVLFESKKHLLNPILEAYREIHGSLERNLSNCNNPSKPPSDKNISSLKAARESYQEYIKSDHYGKITPWQCKELATLVNKVDDTLIKTFDKVFSLRMKAQIDNVQKPGATPEAVKSLAETLDKFKLALNEKNPNLYMSLPADKQLALMTLYEAGEKIVREKSGPSKQQQAEPEPESLYMLK